MVPALVGAGAGVLSGLFGNIFGASQASKNRQFQERMLQKQQDFALDMFNRTNEYNTASNQRKRLEQAGLNPYMLMSGGSAGSASSTSPGGVPSGAQAQYAPPDLSLPASLMQAQANVRLADSQAQNVQADTNLKRIEGRTAFERNRMDILKTSYEIGLIDKQTMRQAIENQYLPHQLAANVEGTRANIERTQAEKKLIDVTRMMNSEQLRQMPIRLRYDIAQAVSNIELNSANVRNIDKVVEKIVWDMKPEFERFTGKKLTDSEAMRLKSALLELKAYEAERAGNNTGPQSLYNWIHQGQGSPSRVKPRFYNP